MTLHHGPYAELHATYARLYREWLPEGGAEPADQPCSEVHLDDPRTTAPKDLRTEIHLPLRDGREAVPAATPHGSIDRSSTSDRKS